MSWSASEKIAKPVESVEEPSFIEVEYALTPICLKLENSPLDTLNKLRDLTLFKLNLQDKTNLLIIFSKIDNINRPQLYPFFKGVYKITTLFKSVYNINYILSSKVFTKLTLIMEQPKYGNI